MSVFLREYAQVVSLLNYQRLKSGASTKVKFTLYLNGMAKDFVPKRLQTQRILQNVLFPYEPLLCLFILNFVLVNISD